MVLCVLAVLFASVGSVDHEDGAVIISTLTPAECDTLLDETIAEQGRLRYCTPTRVCSLF